MPHPVAGAVVVGVDGSPAPEHALEIAFEQTSFRGVDLVAVRGATPGCSVPGVDWTTMQSMSETLSEAAVGVAGALPGCSGPSVVVADRPAHQLLEQAGRRNFWWSAATASGGFAGMLLGSVSTAIVHGAKMPVIVARH